MAILTKIIEYKNLELEQIMRKLSKKDVELKAADQEPARPFLGNFRDEDINIIAEVKKASPSAGVIRADFDPVKIASIYEENGAKAISVLTDEHFFQGRLQYLEDIKEAVQLPLLRKDFTLSEYHIFEGRAHGADALLLIVAALDDHQLKDYNDLILELGMMPLIEVHNQEELERSLKLNIKLLGINNRNLKTFDVKTETTIGLLNNNQIDAPVISESGLDNHDKLLKLKEIGVSGFLIGKTLMASKDMGAKLKELKGT